MKRLCAIILHVALGLVFLSLPTAALEGDADSDLEAEVLALMEEGKIPGLAAAVLVDGEVVWIDSKHRFGI
jgi:CubicO group peptidase (beta-lactamase class C family)